MLPGGGCHDDDTDDDDDDDDDEDDEVERRKHQYFSSVSSLADCLLYFIFKVDHISSLNGCGVSIGLSFGGEILTMSI